MKFLFLRKFINGVVLLLCLFYAFTYYTFEISAYENKYENDGYTIEDIREIIGNESNIEVYSEDGTLETLPNPSQNNLTSQEAEPVSLVETPSFEEVKIVDSGKPDSESIVVTIMGDGFTATEQDTFINAATNAANYLIGNDLTGDIGFYPYNLFRDFFTIYAIKVISEESGVSRDASSNNGNIVNNYFGSSFYYGNDTSTVQRALVITNYSRANSLKKEGSAMTAIICNSDTWGGTGGAYAVMSLHPNFVRIMTHEFGHSFGGLADEYWYPGESFYASERVNKTSNGDPSTNKWRHWFGKTGIYSGIGVFRYSTNPSDIAYNWFKPHNSCQMQSTTEAFCAVCSEELIKRMESITGDFFDTTVISDEQIMIDAVNYSVRNDFEIPPVIDGKKVIQINQEAFKNQIFLETITIPDSVNKICSSAFENCISLSSVNLGTGVTIIDNSVFKGCTSLEEVTIPNSVLSIGNDSFMNCSSLNRIVITKSQKELTSLGHGTFTGCATNLVIEVPDDRIADYKNAPNWTEYRTMIVPDTNVYTTYNINSNINLNLEVNVNAGYNEMYKLNVTSDDDYLITISSEFDVLMKLYNSSHILIDSQTSIMQVMLNNEQIYYLSLEYNDIFSSGDIIVSITNVHVHVYDEYVWYNNTRHLKKCSCGTLGDYEPHAVSPDSLTSGNNFATCLFCGGPASLGIIGPILSSRYLTSINGSFVIPSGVVVLVNDDVEAYMSGSLIFQTQNNENLCNDDVIIYSKRKEYGLNG